MIGQLEKARTSMSVGLISLKRIRKLDINFSEIHLNVARDFWSNIIWRLDHDAQHRVWWKTTAGLIIQACSQSHELPRSHQVS